MPTLTQTSGCKECVVNLHISRRGEGGYAIHSNVNWVICWEYHQKLNINLSEGTPKGLVLHAVRGPQFLPGPLNWVLLFSALHPPPHISFMPNITLPYFSSYDFLPNPTMYFFSLGQKIWLLSSNPHILASIWHIQCSKDIWSSDSEWIRRYQFSFFDSDSQLWSFGWNLNAVHRVTIHPWLYAWPYSICSWQNLYQSDDLRNHNSHAQVWIINTSKNDGLREEWNLTFETQKASL